MRSAFFFRPIGADGPIREVENVSAVERQVLAALSAEEGIHIDTLLEKVPIGAARLLETLLSLEMNQRVVHLPGQHYILQV